MNKAMRHIDIAKVERHRIAADRGSAVMCKGAWSNFAAEPVVDIEKELA